MPQGIGTYGSKRGRPPKKVARTTKKANKKLSKGKLKGRAYYLNVETGAARLGSKPSRKVRKATRKTTRKIMKSVKKK